MPDKLYLWRIKVRGHRLWCHAPDADAALVDFIKQTDEPLGEYCLEWEEPKNLDGSPIDPAERAAALRNY
jgi:hypothetical protein